ncbi:MFS general substrate transporter [Cryphonectria parasitica EP155]|uniref:MFS general substrate transporter n=1 Tax=Cryphonectria parasitica (strain ATCC 38755 / EP155) TaxID=660469 RepID=A0A9P4XTW9_CRYP1|nr:MFS general substrate transporter [Cryphonectria parasitica EP155]KAF3761229.1 MFS general substrate transporter [Cryphonectria parasitica EP155]
MSTGHADSEESAEARPNGGLEAWLQVAGAFVLYFNTWGLLTSFGAFEEYYASDLLSSHTSFEISTIGSLQSFLMVFLGVVTGPLFDMGYFKHLSVIGSLLIVGGTMAQSTCSNLWQLLLAQGACIGAGTGCLAILSVGVPSMWFDTRLPLANGLAACGSGVGGVVFPIVFRRLNTAVGFGWAVRVIGFIALGTLGFANTTMRIPSTSAQSGKRTKRQHRALYDPTALREAPYCLFVVGCFTVFLGLYVPYFYVPSYATAILTKTSQQSHLNGDDLLSILNGVSTVGRVLAGYLAINIGPQNLIVIVAGLTSVVTFCFMAVESNLAGMVALVCFYGFLTGAFFALQPSVYVCLSSHRPDVIGTRFGMAFTIMSFGMLFGSPIAGALMRQAGFWVSWTWAGVCIAAGAILIVLVCAVHEMA